MTVFSTIQSVNILKRRPIDKGKSLFQTVTTTFLSSAKVPASLSSIYVTRKQSTLKTNYIIPRVDIVGPESREFIFGVQDRYKMVAWKCVDMDKAYHTYFSVTGKIFILNCYEFQIIIHKLHTSNNIFFIFLCSVTCKLNESQNNHMNKHKYCNHVDTFLDTPKQIRK